MVRDLDFILPPSYCYYTMAIPPCLIRCWKADVEVYVRTWVLGVREEGCDGTVLSQRAAICELSRVIIPVPIMGWVLRKALSLSLSLSLSLTLLCQERRYLHM